MSGTADAEVLIMGGGPAGAVCAIALADMGRDVLLCEAERFPRRHIGVSFTPGVREQLRFLHLERVLDHPDHAQPFLVEQRWGSTSFIEAPHQRAYIADRARFDLDLLSEASKRGVRVLQPARVREFRRDHNEWTAAIASPAGCGTIRAQFLIDATGRSSSFRRRRRLGSPTVAVSGVLFDGSRATVRISAGAQSWGWSAPTSEGERIALVFTDPDHLRSAGASLEERYRCLLRTTGIASSISGQVRELRAHEATPYATIGALDHMLRIGDADVALDPLSSSGVQAAIQSAIAAAPVVNTLLTVDGDRTAAQDFWRTRRSRQAIAHRRSAALLYAEAWSRHKTNFWKRRSANQMIPFEYEVTPLPRPDQVLRVSIEARFAKAPCIIENRIEQRTCLKHPSLSDPVAFVDGIEIEKMLRGLGSCGAETMIARWVDQLSSARSFRLLGWLWQRRILVPG